MKEYLNNNYPNDNSNEDEIVKFWDNLGFLSGIEEPIKTICAISYHNAYEMIIESEDELECHMGTQLFPIVRRLITDNTGKYNIKIFNKNDILEIYHEMINVKYHELHKYIDNVISSSLDKDDIENKLIEYLNIFGNFTLKEYHEKFNTNNTSYHHIDTKFDFDITCYMMCLLCQYYLNNFMLKASEE